MKLTGECFCGSVSYEIAGSVRDARSCHSHLCRFKGKLGSHPRFRNSARFRSGW